MAARGSESKSIITKKILETFEGSFLNDGGKEIRIPMNEGGEVVQIKVTLTAAKINVEGGNPSSTPQNAVAAIPEGDRTITEAEKKEVTDLIEKLGL